jgi:hypothetical protein
MLDSLRVVILAPLWHAQGLGRLASLHSEVGQVKVNQLPAISFHPLDNALKNGALGDAE